MLNKLRKKREYLLKKEEEYKNQEIENKKNKVLDHLNETSKLSYDLRKDGKNILDEIIYNQKITDDIPQYPKILVTTSKKPSSKLLQFSKHISLIFNGLFFLRGNTTNEELSENLHKNYFTTLILIFENKGMPSSMTISSFPFGDTYKFSISNFQLNRTVNLSQFCHLVTNNINENLKNLFGRMLPAHKGSKRILMLANYNDLIAFRHYLINKGKRVELKNDLACDIKLYEIRKGTFEQEGEILWVFKSFINSHKSNLYNKIEEDTHYDEKDI